jgi:predicted ATPase/DNA-binding SARP family transcriptional activator
LPIRENGRSGENGDGTGDVAETAGDAYFAILGPVAVTAGGAPVPVGGPREKRALAALLLATPGPVSVARLTEVLWDSEPPATAKAQVHNCIARLRGGLGARTGREMVLRSGAGYVIDVRAVDCDALAFAAADEQAIELASRGHTAAAADVLRAALSLWRGPALDGLDCMALQGEAMRLEEQRLAAIERRLDLDLALGRHAAITGELAALVAEHPLRERLVELRMIALYRAGRRLEALEVFNATRIRLAEQTGLDPRPELDRIHKAILTSDVSLDPPATVDDGRPDGYGLLPGLAVRSLPRFIGRERDLAEVVRLLAAHAVVTITGPPGTGKTRLAVEAAARVAPDYPGGVALVALDTVRGTGVPEAILAALDPVGDPWRTPVENIARSLSGPAALLVLDNGEHVATECARVVSVLVAANPRLRVLVTSQVPLGLAVEQRYALGPLTVPTGDTVPAVLASEAGRLLLDRASTVDPAFTLSTVNAHHLARLCRTVEGLPLALELAAGRMRAFSIGQIADRLHHQLEMLTSRQQSPRHASLRAAIDWSHGLLSGRERTVFGRLSVFLGGFTLEAAEAVVGGDQLTEIAVTDTLGALVERSLVVAEPSGEPTGDMRYRMPEALRLYALERLTASEDGAGPVRLRHASHYCEFAEQAEARRRGPDRRLWLDRLRQEYANIRSALTTAHESGNAGLALRLACAMVWFWRRYATREAVDWLRELLPLWMDGPSELRQRALIGAGSLALRVNIEEARGYVAGAVALARDRDDARAEVVALSFMASVEVYLADAGGVAAFADQAVALARDHGDAYLLARTLLARALTQAHVGGARRSDEDLAEALTLFTTLDDRLGRYEVRLARAEVACALGDVAVARAALAVVSEDEVRMSPIGATTYWLCRGWLANATGNSTEVPELLRRALADTEDQATGPYAAQRIFGPALDLAAAVAAGRGEYERAVTLRHAATGVLTLDGRLPDRAAVRWSQEVERVARGAMRSSEYSAAAARGAAMGLVQALRYAGLPTPSRGQRPATASGRPG